MLSKTKSSIPAARWIRIVSRTILVYIIAYMDRMNISFAIAGGMNKLLALSPTSAGVAAGSSSSVTCFCKSRRSQFLLGVAGGGTLPVFLRERKRGQVKPPTCFESIGLA